MTFRLQFVWPVCEPIAVMNDFSIAIELGNAKEVAALLERGDVDVNKAHLSRTLGICKPLAHAVRRGCTAIAILLLNAGARIDDQDEDGQSACHFVARRGWTTLMRQLIAKRANVTLRDRHDQTALDIAVYCENTDIVIALIAANAPLDNTATLCHAAAMSTQVLQMLIERHVNVAALLDSDGRSACHSAAWRSRPVELFAMLVTVGGVDVNSACTTIGSTCAHVCALNGLTETLRWLIAAGADVERADNDGRSALHNACQGHHFECVALLVAAGVDALARDRAGKLPMTIAIESISPRNPDFGSRLIHLLIVAMKPESNDDDAQTVAARRTIARVQLDFVRSRALQVCLGLYSLELDALQMCTVLRHACGPVAALVPFHRWWAIATTIKHYHERKRRQ